MARLRIDLDRATFLRLVVAAAAERDKIARQLFGTVVVTNRTAVAVMPRPDLRPYFAVNPLVESCKGGSDGGRGRVLELFTPRRVVVPDLRPRQCRHLCGTGYRYSLRARKLTAVEEATIRALAATRNLRSLAAEFGVSHETVRAICRGQVA